jgi:N-acetylglucosamine-6-phosphate deacetylase
MSARFLTGAAILQNGGWLHGHGVLIREGRIEAVLPERAAAAAPHRQALPPGTLLAPGLIDIQVNGGGGLLFNDDPTPGAARAIAAAHRRLGTTAILPTLITDTPERFFQAGDAASAGEGVLGIHFEGPFLCREKPGVHRPDLIRQPEQQDIDYLCALAARIEGRVMVTLAPETVSDAAIARLSAAGVRVSAGHSAASFERAEAAIAAGLTGFTHVFNAMTPPAARDPGLVCAALLHGADTWRGVIADLIHVHPAMLRLLLATGPADRIMLVSDSMPPAGTGETQFELQGRTIFQREGRLVTASGTLAGADICLAEAVRRMRRLGVPAEQALIMASGAPAAFLGLQDRMGGIFPGARADLVLFDAALEVLGTWLAGAWQAAAP